MISSPVLPRCWVVIALPLRSAELVDAGVGGDHELVILRIERGDVADIGGLARERRLAVHAVDRRDRVAEADIGLALVDAAHIGDAGARQHLHLEAGDRLLPHVLELAAERNPRAALRAGHHFQIGGGGRRGERQRQAQRRKRMAEFLHRSLHGGSPPCPSLGARAVAWRRRGDFYEPQRTRARAWLCQGRVARAASAMQSTAGRRRPREPGLGNRR